MAKYIPKIIEPALNYVPSADVEDIVSYASKAMRLKIITDRYTRGFVKADRKGGKEAYEHERSSPNGNNKSHRQTIGRPDSTVLYDGKGHIVSETKQQVTNAEGNGPVIDYISLTDFDYRDEQKAVRHFKSIRLPFVPRQLEYNIESSFVGIASFGRNNPFYQYTGSEDTLSFQIDWFSEHNHREDVIFNCRWVEALTKSNGYDEPPHRVYLQWGTNNVLFDGVLWVVTSANYILSDFVKAYRDQQGSIVPVNMLPQQARQEIKLKRITRSNRTTSEIIGSKRF